MPSPAQTLLPQRAVILSASEGSAQKITFPPISPSPREVSSRPQGGIRSCSCGCSLRPPHFHAFWVQQRPCPAAFFLQAFIRSCWNETIPVNPGESPCLNCAHLCSR